MSAASITFKRTKLKKPAKTNSRLSFADDEGGDEEVFQVKKSNLSRKLATGLHHTSSGSASPSSLDQPSVYSRSNGGPIYDKAYLSELKASTPTSRPPPPGNEYQRVETVDIFAMADETETAMTLAIHDDEPRGPHPESRLMREEDELGEGDDEFAEYTSAQEMIALGKKSKKLESQKRRDNLREMIADAEEEDDETLQWEQEQVRRGGQVKEAKTGNVPAKPTYKAAPIPPATTVPALGPSMARLSQTLSDLTTSHTNTTSSLNSISEERAQIEAREVEMREMIRKAEAKRSWFVAFREWVESVAAFLDEKFPQLEKLEEQHLSILKERSDKISQRRRADDEDDLSLFFGDLPNLAQSKSEELDELGRIVPKANPTVARRERQAARAARRSRRSSHTRDMDTEEGYSTDSSLPPSDAKDYRTALSNLAADGKDILADVRAVTFRNPSRGLGEWFGQWRAQYGDSYTGAWGGLGLVAAWEFWVRLETLGWNPLEDSKSLDGFTWYSSLYEYSHPGLEDDERAELGPDGDLVSAMISTAIVPTLCKAIGAKAFDPYSANAMRRILDITEQVEASIEVEHAKFQMFLKTVTSSFHLAVVETETMVSQYRALNKPRFDPEAIPARQRFLTRRVKLLQNLLRWRKYTGEKFGIGEMITRVVGNSILPVAESAWEVGGEECIRKVAAFLPTELVPQSMANRLQVG